MEQYRGMTDAELLRRLRRGREGPARNLYHLKVVEYERQRRCRGGAAPPEDNGEEEEEEEGPDHAHRPSPTWQEPNPEELQERPRPPDDHAPCRLLPLGPQLLVLGLLGAGLAVLGWWRGGA